MSFCTNCGQGIPANAEFCTNCGAKSATQSTSPSNSDSSANVLDVYGGRLSFDSNELTFTRDTQKVVEDSPGLFKMVTKLATVVAGNLESNQVIPLGLIDSVEVTRLDFGLIGKIPISGDLAGSIAGGIRIFTASGGPRSEQGFSFLKGQEENANRFVAALKLACANRGRKTEIVSGSASQEIEDTKVCPDCAEDVKKAARVCRFCGHNFG